MHFNPAQSWLGCSLLVGVEVACCISLIINVSLIAVCSSTEPLNISGIIIPPEVQVFAASWAFAGVPIVVVAGVGVLHRIEQAVRLYFYYMCASFVVSLIVPFWFVVTNSLCDLVVHPDLQSQGTAFVCGFAQTFVVTWALMLALIQCYTIFIIWSACEDIAKNPYPELNRYNAALKSADFPPVVDASTGATPEMMARAALGSPNAPLVSMPNGGGGMRQEGFPGPGPVSMELNAAEQADQAYHFGGAGRGFEAGEPQSFVPAPQRGACLASGMSQRHP